MSAATTAGEFSTQASPDLKAQPLAQALATASALLTCWRLSLPADGPIGCQALSTLQVSMRAVCELLAPAADEYSDKCPNAHPAGNAAMFADGLVQTIESALWNLCSDDAEPDLLASELVAAARFAQLHLAEALRAVSSGWHINPAKPQGGAA